MFRVVRARLRDDLTAALKARDAIAVSALRSAIAAIDNAEAIDVAAGSTRPTASEHIAGARAGAGSSDAPRRELSDADIERVLRAQVEECRQAAEDYERFGRTDEAERLRGEADVLVAYVSDG